MTPSGVAAHALMGKSFRGQQTEDEVLRPRYYVRRKRCKVT
jgi:hypothetical protein